MINIVPYLLLFSFFSGHLTDFGLAKINVINATPYNGVAVSLIDAYQTKMYAIEHYQTSIELIKRESKKHIWPIVYFNRLVGLSKASNITTDMASLQYFKKIKGLALDCDDQALKDLLSNWSDALRIAKHLGAPGIVVDPEFYNNSSMVDIRQVAKVKGISCEDIRLKLRKVGAMLSDITEEVFPDARLWFLFSGLGEQRFDLPKSENFTQAIIVRGLLERALETKAGFLFISGGEISLFYCSDSLPDLKNKIGNRNKAFEKILKEFPFLQLGGTLAPWREKDLRKTWMKFGRRCSDSQFANLDSFVPALKLLCQEYEYVWIYAAWAACYNPYDPEAGPIYNSFLNRALSD